MTDLEIIKKIEVQTKAKLKKLAPEEFEKKFYKAWINEFSINKQNSVIYFRLDNLQLNKSVINLLLYLKNLKTVSLSRTFLTDYSFLKELSNLSSLDLSWNKNITDYSFLKELSNLSSLDLRSNNLSDVSFLKEFSNLSSLDLADNPITEPPPEIVKQGIEGIRNYYKSLEKEKRPLNEVKVILVGDGGAGKTSLLKRILNKDFNPKEPQTHGLNIINLDKLINKENVKIHFWDFGGQEIMHATHQFFLSKRSLYILVLDGRKEEDAEYWLKHIESFGGNSPIIAVLNKIDLNSSFEVNRKFLRDKYKRIIDFFRISCETDKGINTFKKRLFSELLNVELIKSEWGIRWFNIKKKLENLSTDYINFEDYNKICSDEEITDDSQKETLVSYLNELGVILNFKDFELSETYILEPKWATEAVYKIINSKISAENKGIIPKNDLNFILNKEEFTENFYQKTLKKKTYKRKEQQYIVNLMKKFKLCFELDENNILIPDLLDVEEPEFDFDYNSSLKFVLEYDFFPKSIMPRFIVNMKDDIKEKLRWRTGVVLEDTTLNCIAVIKADKNEKRIFIDVIGEQKKEYFSIIRKVFRTINNSFERLITKELIPIFYSNKYADEKGNYYTDGEGNIYGDGTSNVIYVEYEELVGYEKAGRDDYFIGKIGESFSVNKLLNGVEKPEERFVKERLLNVINFNPKIEVKTETNVEQKQEVKQEMNFELNIEIPKLQSEFDNFKDYIIENNPEFERKVFEIGDCLDKITNKSDINKFTKPLNKLGRFINELGDENSKYNKIIKGTKKGLEIAKKIASTYSKIADFIPGAPTIPRVLLD